MGFLLNPFRYGVAATDPHFASTKLLLSCDGANGSTTFTDESAAARGAATVTNQAQVSTALAKYGTGSLRLDGVGDDIKYADHADWTLSTSDFTIECWASFDTTWIESNAVLFSHYNTTSNQRGWIFDYRGGEATNNLRFAASSNGTSAAVIVSGNWTPTADTFYHLVAERSGTTFRLYIDGTMLAKATNAIDIFNSTASLIIGETANSADPMKGNIDEPRITLGVARYNSDSGYTLPTAPFPRS
jgi:hypothetical protein